MYYSDEIIEEVRSRSDIVDIISGYTKLTHKGNSYSACCPFHHEKTPSFHVSRAKQMYHCFGCGVGGNVFTFVMEYENFSFPEAVRFLAEKAGVELPEGELSEEDKKKESLSVRLKEVNMSAAAYFHYILKKTERGKLGYKYFTEQRRLNDETIDNFGLGFSDIYFDDLYKYLRKKGYTDDIITAAGLCEYDEKKGMHDRFWNRVMVPILDINGKVVGFGGRVLGDGKPKYVNTKETPVFDKSHLLFAMNIARKSKRKGMILCEGYMDVISMHQAGFDNAIASLGTAFTIGQANLIKRYKDEVYLAYDSDEAGVKAALKAIPMLRSLGIGQRVIDMSPYKDPDEFLKAKSKEDYEERIKNAAPGMMFEIKHISEGYNRNDPEEKTKFMHETARKLSELTDIAARNNYIEAVANEFMLEKDILKAKVSEYGMIRTENQAQEEASEIVKKEVRSQAVSNKEQKLLLTWMVNYPYLFDKLDGVVSEEDFSEGDYRAVASALYGQYRRNGSVNPAAIVNIFEDVDKQRLVAEMLQTETRFSTTKEETEQAILEVIKRIKLDNIERELSLVQDINKLASLIKKKQEVMNLKISIR